MIEDLLFPLLIASSFSPQPLHPVFSHEVSSGWKRTKFHQVRSTKCETEKLVSKEPKFIKSKDMLTLDKHLECKLGKVQQDLQLFWWFWKCGPQTNSTNSTWELASNANSLTLPCALTNFPSDSDTHTSLTIAVLDRLCGCRNIKYLLWIEEIWWIWYLILSFLHWFFFSSFLQVHPFISHLASSSLHHKIILH